MSVVRVRIDKERIKDKVLVLLSSYNGEKYIREQLDSLLGQTMPVFILIRDDGSSDRTISIIHEYMAEHDNIKLIEGKNLGFVGSFNSLICNELVDEYEWAAFCDQDDVWLPEKLSAAVSMIKKDYDAEIPTLYCSNLIAVDEKLNKIKLVNDPDRKKYLSPILCNCIIAGCTCVFNHSAAKVYKTGINNSIIAHDNQIHSVCYYLGRFILDDNAYIYYRQHNSNVSGFAPSKPSVCGLINEIFHPKPKRRVAHFKEFMKAYGNYLSNAEKEQLQIFIDHEHSFSARLRIFFSSKFRTDNFMQTIAFKIRALINRMY
ncbi:MAG: glycosyltransferase [Oscillospiraceae bacterium]|nr:glycosyltransferase [Oscillospiraceae bacterium]